MSYIGKTQLKASDIKRFNVTGSTSATHTLSWVAPNEQSLIITINGVKQQEDAYSVSGVTLTLTSALVTTDKMEVVGIVDIGQTVVPGTGVILNEHVNASAAIAQSKLSLDITNSDINASAAIAQSKLSLDVTNSDVNASAAIAQSKLANVPFYTSSATAPTSPTPVAGDIWYDSTASGMKVFNGSSWSFMGGLTSYTGGTYTTYTHDSVDYGIRTFTSSGILGVSGSMGTIDFLVIAGGGGGGYDNGGGGGAGGVVWTSAANVATGNHTVTIGAGGAPGAASGINPGSNGANSIFSTATALGGGGAGGASMDGADGGSGGGGSRNYVGGSSTQGASGGTAFANSASSSTNSSSEGGGGGGAGAAGAAGTSGIIGSGGIGVSTFVNSSATETTAFLLAALAGTDSSNVATDGSSTGTLYIAGGGAGGTQQSGRTAATTAAGGGAPSVSYTTATGVDALVNTGSGGGSSGTGSGTGGSGGSGIVIVRYVI